MYINRLFFRKDTVILIFHEYKNGSYAGNIPTIDDDFKSLEDLK